MQHSLVEKFDDPVLDQLILEALANNQDLQLAISRVCEYYAAYRIARAPLLPFLDLSGTMGPHAQLF